MRRIARFGLAMFILALAGLAGTTNSTYSQELPGPGTILICPFDGDITINQNGRDFVGTVNGFGAFEVLSSTPFNPEDPTSRNRLVTRAVDIGATSIFPELGTFTTRLNLNAPVTTISEIVSANPGPAIFPLEVDMRYDAIVTGPDGRQYLAINPVNFRTTTANTINPFVNEVTNLEGPVQFVSPEGNFTLVRLTATFNP
jgi:hypothetical protein